MRTVRTWCIIATLFAAPTLVAAQTTNGTISGHVVDAQGLALPGVTVSAASPNLQGVQSATTSDNGDYIFTLLPSGVYTVSFELSGFEVVRKQITLAPTQTLLLDAALGLATVSESVTVVAHTADVLTRTGQVATNFNQELISTLPTTRDINATLLLSPSVHPSGPGGALSISGAASFESLFMVNGVSVNENLRGQPNALYIEDAIQETTVATAGISAEYGRFTGGVVNVITKSGGNVFSGTFRDTLNNDNWRALTPFPGDAKTVKTIPTYEYTIGGPVAKDRLWFFTAGRLQNQDSTRQTVLTNIPYTLGDDQKRYEAKLTYSANSSHRFQGAYTKTLRDQTNGNGGFNVMDVSSLFNGSNPQDLVTLNYNGVLSSTFFVEGRFSMRHWTSEGVGSQFRDLLKGTLVTDRTHGTRYWSPTFCGVCDPEKRDNGDVFVKGSYFLSKKGTGSHTMVFGFDGFNDQRFANNYQSGSNYRILGTSSVVRGTTVYPQFLSNGSTLIQYNPITVGSQGTNFRTYSAFYSDSWRANDAFTFNLGLRWDKNHGEDGAGQLVARDSALSPRLGVIWDPTRKGQWAVTASFAQYVDAIASTIGDASSPGGNSTTIIWPYLGPAINSNSSAAALTATPDAIQQVLGWYNANGATLAPVFVQVPGLTTRIPQSLESPHVLEYAAGVSRQIGNRAAVRADFVYRDWRDFYSLRTDQSTGTVVDQYGNRLDLGIMQNTNDLTRRYSALTLVSTYRVGSRTDIGGNYTLSHLWGNFDGESINSGPLAADLFQYPEYRQPSWYAPVGDLSADQRHRSSIWVNYGVPRVDGLTLSAIEAMASGAPYGAIGQVNAIPYVINPGYATPQGSTSENYYFTARDAYRTDAAVRTDFGASYRYGLKARGRQVDLFVQAQVLNLFNQLPVCGCGDSVFNSGGPVGLTRIGQTVLTNVTTPTLARFNPLSATPAPDVNWKPGSNFGTPLSRLAYQSPRTFRLTFGVRF